MKMKLTKATLALLATTALATPAPAAVITWNGSVNDLWSNASNWTTGLPTTTSNVQITNSTNNPVLMDIAVNLSGGTGACGTTNGCLTVGAGESLVIQNTLTMTTRPIILNGGSITASGGGTISATTGTVTGFGTFSAPDPGSHTFTANGTAGNPLILDGGNNYSGTFASNATGGMQFNSGSTFTGTFSGTGGTFNVNGANLGAATLTATNGIWNVTADSALTGAVSFNQYNTFFVGGSNGAHTLSVSGNLSTVSGGADPFNIGTGGTVNWTAAGAGSMGGGGTVRMTGGTLSSTGGLFTVGDPLSGNGTVTGNVALAAGNETVAGGTLTVGNGVTIGTSGSGPGFAVGNGNTLDLQGNITAWAFNINPGAGGNVNFDGANITSASGTKSINNSGLPFSGTFTVTNPSTLTNIAFSTGTSAVLNVNAGLTLGGTSTVDAANITVGANGGFSTGTTNAVTDRGSFTNGASSAANYSYNGTSGLGPDLHMLGGTMATPVTLSMGSTDLGYIPAGFNNNFALNSLTVNANAYVQLGSTLYLNGLFGTSTTMAGAGTLDLDGFNAYLAGYGMLVVGYFQDSNGDYVNVVNSVAAVPEPSTWAMMAIGFVGLGFSFRQRRRKVCFA
jgi:hypothetical protein